MAKAFSFSLQKVLDIRNHMEKQKAIELGKAQSRLELEKRNLNGLEESKTKFLSSAQEELGEQPSLADVRVRESYLQQLTKKIEVQNSKVIQQQKLVADKRQVLLEAVKERKIVENLKTRKLEEFHRQSLKAERKRDDDMVAGMVIRKMESAS